MAATPVACLVTAAGLHQLYRTDQDENDDPQLNYKICFRQVKDTS